MFKSIQQILFFIVLASFLLPLAGVVFPFAQAEEEKKEKTPMSMLRAIEQRNTELDQKAKQLELKEYRLRILEQEVSENLKKTKDLRDDMAKIRAEQKAADAKRAADAKADAARKEEAKKGAVVADQGTAEEKARAIQKAEEEEALLRKKEEERKALQTQQFAKLAKIYETMPPEDAALRLQNMKDDFALAIIPLMKDKKAAKVLGVMDPIVAAKFTEQMAMHELSQLTAAPGKKNRR
ncbi:MAG: hypothetical protein HY201_01055 [Nitrospirae bacterium]|nr:hypothetical protein [Candidatus Troglogloeales bacterium]MBI3598039.1 hypothetical protein [Candidatus Troglogloeales bacterium]